jgi:hypothetical protein
MASNVDKSAVNEPDPFYSYFQRLGLSVARPVRDEGCCLINLSEKSGSIQTDPFYLGPGWLLTRLAVSNLAAPRFPHRPATSVEK